MTRDPFKLGSPNLDQRCKRPWLISLLFLRGDWPWPSRSNLTSKSKFTPFWACPDHNSLPIQARITKFGPEVENSLVKVLIVLSGNLSWPSRSNLIWTVKFFYQTYLCCFCKYLVTIACIHLVRPSLATDPLSWLLTYISFVVDHQWTVRLIIDIAIDSIHIGRRIFSVNHSGAQCLQPPVHRDLHACATQYLISWHGISKHQNTGEFCRNCRAEYGIASWRTIYSNAQ